MTKRTDKEKLGTVIKNLGHGHNKNLLDIDLGLE